MNATSNLPEPTYRFNNALAHIKNTRDFLKSIVFLTKKVLML